MFKSEYGKRFEDRVDVLDRKFEDRDLKEGGLMEFAIEFANDYTNNDNPFMVSMHEQARLTFAQARGVLNVARAIYLRSKRPAAILPPESAFQTVVPGTYTIVLNGNEEDYVTLRVRAWKPSLNVVGYLMGNDNSRDYVGFATINVGSGKPSLFSKFRGNQYSRLDHALSLLVKADLAEAGALYALKSGNCCRCGRKLTVPVSLHRGMGPICAELDFA